MRMRYLVLPLLLALAAGAQAKPDQGPFRKIAVIQLREDPDEQIDPSVSTSVLRRLKEIEAWGADCIVLDIESYGGLVTASIDIGDELYDVGRRIHTIAYVRRRAISGAVMIALSCQEIVMNEVASMGDSQAVFLTPEGLQEAPEKIQTNVATKFRTYAKGNGYPEAMAEAMVRKEMEVTRYRKPGDETWVYLRTDDAVAPPKPEELAKQGLTEKQVVVPAGQLATFGAMEAVDYGFCSRLEPDIDSLLDSLRTPETLVRRYDWTWAEETSRWLLGMRVWLFLIGVGALYFAMKMPGTGVPEALAVLAFGLFFGASYVAGFASALEVVLFLVGLALIVVEIFVIPGFGFAGVAGIACLLVALGLSAIPPGDELPATEGTYLIPLARDFLFGAFGAVVLVFFIARNLPRVPLFRSLSLEPPAPGAPLAAVDVAAQRPSSLIGERGVAETRLRPAGRARIAGEHRDVVAEGRYVEPGATVRVVAVEGNRIVVRPEETPGT